MSTPDPNLDRLRAHWPNARRDTYGDICYDDVDNIAVEALQVGWSAVRPINKPARDGSYIIGGCGEPYPTEAAAVEAVLRAAEAEGWLPAPAAALVETPGPSYFTLLAAIGSIKTHLGADPDLSPAATADKVRVLVNDIRAAERRADKARGDFAVAGGLAVFAAVVAVAAVAG